MPDEPDTQNATLSPTEANELVSILSDQVVALEAELRAATSGKSASWPETASASGGDGPPRPATTLRDDRMRMLQWAAGMLLQDKERMPPEEELKRVSARLPESDQSRLIYQKASAFMERQKG